MLGSNAITVCLLVVAFAATCARGDDECPTIYLAMPRDEFVDHFDRSEALDVSVFSVLVSHTPLVGRTIVTRGMLVRGHGRTFLVPAASSVYVYTGDSVRVKDSGVPDCLLDALDGKIVSLGGTVGEHDGQPTIDRLLYLREEPATAYLAESPDSLPERGGCGRACTGGSGHTGKPACIGSGESA